MRTFTKYKAVVKDKKTKERTIIETECTSKRFFIEELRRNGYSVNRNKVKKAKVFDYIMNHTNATPQDWKEIKEVPKEEVDADVMTFIIPDKFYRYGTPTRTDYMDDDGQGLKYKEGGEMAFELASAFGGNSQSQYTVVSLLSPWVLGWDNNFDASEIELVDVDIEARIVKIRRKR